MSEDDDFTDEIQLYGAIGVGGALLAYNMRSPPLTPNTVIVPVVAAGVWYLFTPLVSCMLGGKGLTFCLAKSATETAADAGKAAAEVAVGVAKGAAGAAWEVTKTVANTVNDVGADAIEGAAAAFAGRAPGPNEPAKLRWEYEIERLDYACGVMQGATLGFTFKNTYCQQKDDVRYIKQTPEEVVKYGVWEQWETWDCRTNNKCVDKKMKMTGEIHTTPQGTKQVMIGGTVVGDAVTDDNGKVVGMVPSIMTPVENVWKCFDVHGQGLTEEQCKAKNIPMGTWVNGEYVAPKVTVPPAPTTTVGSGIDPKNWLLTHNLSDVFTVEQNRANRGYSAHSSSVNSRFAAMKTAAEGEAEYKRLVDVFYKGAWGENQLYLSPDRLAHYAAVDQYVDDAYAQWKAQHGF